MKILIFVALVSLTVMSCASNDNFIGKWHDNNGRVAEIKNLTHGKYLLTITHKNKIKDINLNVFYDTLYVVKDKNFYEFEKNLPDCDGCSLKSIGFVIDKDELRGIISFANSNGVEFTATEQFYK